MADFDALTEVNALIQKTLDRLAKSRASLAGCEENIALLESSRLMYAGFVADDKAEIAKLTRLRDELITAQTAAAKAVTPGDGT